MFSFLQTTVKYKVYINKRKCYNNTSHRLKKIIRGENMKSRDIRLLLEAKKDRLINIAERKRRSKNAEEKARFEDRFNKARKYLGEIEILYSYISEVSYFASIVNEDYIDFLNKYAPISKVFLGDFVKIYRKEDSQTFLVILASVTDIENFK